MDASRKESVPYTFFFYCSTHTPLSDRPRPSRNVRDIVIQTYQVEAELGFGWKKIIMVRVLRKLDTERGWPRLLAISSGLCGRAHYRTRTTNWWQTSLNPHCHCCRTH